MKNLTREYLLNLFEYRRDEGLLIWKNHWDPCVVTKLKGKMAGSPRPPLNYWHVGIACKTPSVHRIIWLLETGKWPTFFIDHIDGNPSNNKITNLREVSHRRNCLNRSEHRKGNLFGTSYLKKTGKWMARIRINKKSKYLGVFDFEEEAHEMYKNALGLIGEDHVHVQ